jgi:nucleotide-binding universal stress UspA family protein
MIGFDGVTQANPLRPGTGPVQRADRTKAGGTMGEGGGGLVVVGVDGSEESVAALRWAADYAKAAGATVQALIAWHYPDGAGAAPVGHAPAPVRHESEEHIRATLDQAVRQVYPDPAAAGVQTRIAYGHPSQALVEASKEASLLVVGSRGQGAFTGMLLGSVSMHCVTGAFCPVTVVRHN